MAPRNGLVRFAHFSVQHALRNYLYGMRFPAMANLVTDDVMRMTNHDWACSQAALQPEFGMHCARDQRLRRAGVGGRLGSSAP